RGRNLKVPAHFRSPLLVATSLDQGAIRRPGVSFRADGEESRHPEWRRSLVACAPRDDKVGRSVAQIAVIRRRAGHFAKDEAFVQEEPLAQDESTARNEPLVEDEAFIEDEALVQEEPFAQDEAFIEDEALVEQEAFVQEKALAQRETVGLDA